MRWIQRKPFEQSFLRSRMRRAALRLARHGWAVTPGGYLQGERMRCDRADCLASSCHPVLVDWADRSSRQPDQINEWWGTQPHAVLLPTGQSFDVIEVPALLGSQAVCGPTSGPYRASATGRLRAPVAVTAAGRWMFLVQPGAELVCELDHRVDIVRHGLGSWIPAPPTVLPDGPVRWQVSPEQVNWRLPNSEDLQRALVLALVALDAAFLDLPVGARRRLAPLGRPRTTTAAVRPIRRIA
jgi:hypothetical protein